MKPTTMWVVVNRGGYPFDFTVRERRKDAIRVYMDYWAKWIPGQTWNRARKECGLRVVKIMVTEITGGTDGK